METTGEKQKQIGGLILYGTPSRYGCKRTQNKNDFTIHFFDQFACQDKWAFRISCKWQKKCTKKMKNYDDNTIRYTKRFFVSLRIVTHRNITIYGRSSLGVHRGRRIFCFYQKWMAKKIESHRSQSIWDNVRGANNERRWMRRHIILSRISHEFTIKNSCFFFFLEEKWIYEKKIYVIHGFFFSKERQKKLTSLSAISLTSLLSQLSLSLSSYEWKIFFFVTTMCNIGSLAYWTRVKFAQTRKD